MEGVFQSPDVDFVDNKDKVYDAMYESLSCILHAMKFPRLYDDDQIRGYVRELTNVLERADKLKGRVHEETEHD